MKIINEVRSNPDKNVKHNMIDILRQMAADSGTIKNEFDEIPNLFVSFTDVNKLGVNPSSTFTETPNGMYAYDVKFILDQVGGIEPPPKNLVHVETIPFASDRPYMQVFSVKDPSKVLVISQDGDFPQEFLEKLRVENESLVAAIHTAFKEGRPAFLGLIRYIAKQRTNGDMGQLVGFRKAHNFVSRLIKKLGYVGIVDLGTGAIHHAEETQSVFFSRDDIVVKKVLLNGEVAAYSDAYKNAENKRKPTRGIVGTAAQLFDENFKNKNYDLWIDEQTLYGNTRDLTSLHLMGYLATNTAIIAATNGESETTLKRIKLVRKQLGIFVENFEKIVDAAEQRDKVHGRELEHDQYQAFKRAELKRAEKCITFYDVLITIFKMAVQKEHNPAFKIKLLNVMLQNKEDGFVAEHVVDLFFRDLPSSVVSIINKHAISEDNLVTRAVHRTISLLKDSPNTSKQTRMLNTIIETVYRIICTAYLFFASNGQ